MIKVSKEKDDPGQLSHGNDFKLKLRTRNFKKQELKTEWDTVTGELRSSDSYDLWAECGNWSQQRDTRGPVSPSESAAWTETDSGGCQGQPVHERGQAAVEPRRAREKEGAGEEE